MAKKITADTIRKLRAKTGAPVMRVKKVLEQFDGDLKKSEKLLKKEGFEKAKKREGRATDQGLVVSYVHHSGKIVGVVELLCETDFVARNKLFVTTANDLAMQVASMNPKNVKDLEGQAFIKNPKTKISDLVREVITKTGENVRIGRIFRLELGK